MRFGSLQKNKLSLFLGLGCIVLFVFFSVAFGGADVKPLEALRALFSADAAENLRIIVLRVRLPRALAAIVCGAALAVSGLLLQSALQNHLASPGIMGVNHGAALFVLLGSLIFPFSFTLREIFAFAGALFAAAGVLLLSGKAGASKSSLILSGVAVSSLLTAGINLLIFLKPGLVTDRVAFSVGSLSNTDTLRLLPVIPVVLLSLAGAYLLSGGIDLFALGDETAAGLGLNVRRHRLLTVLCASLLAGAAVSLCGLISFVGLIIPNIVRITGKSTRQSLGLSIVWGSAFLLICDFISKLLFYPFEMPVGILLSLLGAPFFIYILIKRRRKAV